MNNRLSYEGDIPGTLSTMQRMTPTEGATGELAPLLGAAALGPVSPFIAPFLNPITGSGLGGAITTIASNPVDSEAGLLSHVGNVFKGSAIKKGANWVFPDGRLMNELPTDHVGREYLQGKNFQTLVDDIGRTFKKEGLDTDDSSMIQRGIGLGEYNVESIGGFMKRFGEGTGGTLSRTKRALTPPRGWHMGSSIHGPGEIRVQDIARTPKDIISTLMHETQHGLQSIDQWTDNAASTMSKAFRRPHSEVPYAERLHEVEARIAGRRADFDKALTDPSNKYGIHPMLDYNGKKFVVNNEYAESLGKHYDTAVPPSDRLLLHEEAARLNELVNNDFIFNQKVRKAYNPYNKMF